MLPDAIEQRRLDTLGRIESLLVAKIMEQRDEQVSSGADPEDLFIRSFMPLRAFWIGFLMLEGLNWGVLNIPMSDDRSFMGVCYKSVSMSIRNMIDLNDWMVGTNPPGSRLPFFVDGLSSLIPILGRSLGESWHSMHSTPGFNASFNDVIDNLETEEWGLDLERFK